LINGLAIAVFSVQNNLKNLLKKRLFGIFELTILGEKFILTNVAKIYLETRLPEKTVGK